MCAASGHLQALSMANLFSVLAAALLGLADGAPWPLHPTWAPTYEMAASTIMMPCNTSGWFDARLAARYGIADFDWSNGRDIWANGHPMDDAEVLIKQVAKVKAINPKAHVWVYRNLVKALSWYRDVSEKLVDPAYSGWFLHFDVAKSTYVSPPCTERVCSNHYHSQDQTPQHLTGRKECLEKCDCGGVPCGEYIWDHRNASLREWLVSKHVMGALGMGNANVSGFYFDDYWINSGEGWANGPAGLPYRGAKDVNLSDCKTGPSEIQINCLEDMGLSVQDVVDLNDGWRKTTAAAMRAVAGAGGWVWQMFSSGTPIAHEAEGAACVAALKASCQATSTQQTRMCFSGLTLKDHHTPGSVVDPESDVARFLLTRGPYAFLGTSWVGCEPDNGVEGGGKNQTYVRPEAFDYDYGTPKGLCAESPGKPGLFTREWTKVTVQHDCNTGKSSITPNHAREETDPRVNAKHEIHI